MLSKSPSKTQLGFYSTFGEQLSHNQPLYILANQIKWEMFEDAFPKNGVFINTKTHSQRK